MLIGRESECARIDELLDRARLGRSGTLLLQGEAGIGKTALLDYAAERAEGMTVVRALGVESEAELEFSGLLDACRPVLEHIAELPEQQGEALSAALGVGPTEAFDRFAIGAATLSLLAAAAEANALLVLIDDAQWLDQSSQDALLFATRRLKADRVLVLYAAREGEERSFEAPGIDSLSLAGLPREDATQLLRKQGEVSAEVADQLYEATGGNPLALLELPTLLSPDQLTGSASIDQPLPAGENVERAFARRAQALSEETRSALLVAATSTSSDAGMITGALTVLGLSASSLEPAEDAGLLRLSDGRLEFRHPLVRSAVYQGAVPSERRAAHRALADVCGVTGPEECAWHLAGAALGPDEEAAAALEQAADVARSRSGYAAAAAALQRAAQLTPERGNAVRRLAKAADAAWRAGRTDLAAELVAEALVEVGDPHLRAEALRLQGAIEYVTGRSEAAAASLLEAVELLESVDPQKAVAVAADAVNALVRIGQMDEALETALKARALAPEDGSDTDFEATLALGFALWLVGRAPEAETQLGRALQLFSAGATIPGPLQAGRLASALDWLGRYGDGQSLLSEAVARTRAVGAVGSLPGLLAVTSWQALHASRWNEAQADAGEALELARELDQPVAELQALGVLTWLHALRGDEKECRAYAEETRRRAATFGLALYEHLVVVCLGLLDLGAGRIDEAIAGLEATARGAVDRRLYIPGVAARFELVEAYVRAGRAAEATAILDSFASSGLSSPLLSVLAVRCRALLADGDRFDADFQEALGLHAEFESPFTLARTQLCFGERLRRAGRRNDARDQLRPALETFERLGANAWAKRARSELRASGETLRRRDAFEPDQLTPQELQIALQVAEGKSNKEVGGALFLSHKTIEFHLSRIYRKLDIHSRAELIRQFAGQPVAGEASG